MKCVDVCDSNLDNRVYNNGSACVVCSNNRFFFIDSNNQSFCVDDCTENVNKGN